MTLEARRGRPDLALIVATLLGLALAIVLFGQGGQDDTYISYWPARTLAEHGEIVNYNGIRLEQSSSLSLVVLLALLYELLPLSMPSVGYLASLAGAACAGLLAVRLAGRMGLRSRLGVLAAIATAPSFGYWATSGMETPWVAVFALWFIGELTTPTRRRRDWAGLALAALLFAGVRPEAPLLLGGLCVAFLGLGALRRRAGVEEELGTALRWQRAGVGLAAIVFVFAFRKLYFDAWWPNAALIKAGGFGLRDGVRYLGLISIQAGGFPLLLFGAGAVAVLRRGLGRGSEVGMLVTALGLAQLAFLVASGGDWMTGARFLAPIVPALVLTGFVALETLARSPRMRRGLAVAYCVLNLACSVRLLHLGISEGQPLWTMRGVIERVERRIGPSLVSRVELLNKIHRRDAVTWSELLPIADAVVAQLPSRRVQVMTGQAGMLAYHLAARHPGRVNILDLWSLTDRQLLDCFPPGSIDSSQWGTLIGTYRPLAEHELLEARCGLPLPDIFYNEGLEAHLPKLFAKLGYELVYHQVGSIENSRGGFFQASYPAFGFIAVKRELADAIGLRKKPVWRWDLDPR